ncbi:MAG: DUF2845 domain-containing protein [Steroidobacteraceae bacterium]
MKTLAFAIVVLLSMPAGAETFRCGQRIASPDMTVEELLETCGEPTSKTVEVVDVYGPNVHGAGNVKRGTTTIEKWTYDRGPQAFAMLVTIEDGKIKGMERSE